MTQTGKCDTCRSRKVKCDEQRPKCGSCQKRDRECRYTFGKASAFVVEDPTQLSKYGKSKVAPKVYPLGSGDGTSSSSTAASSPSASSASAICSTLALRQTTSRDAEAGEGVFLTLATPKNDKYRANKRKAVQQRRKLQLYMSRLQALTTPPTLSYFVSSQNRLAARYLNLLGARPYKEQPFAILGTWVETIPSRIGKSPAVDLAIEYLIHSFDIYREPNFSKLREALSVKAKALTELQLLIGDARTAKSYDAAIATKIHFIAEVFIGIKTLYHAIYAAGLGDILQYGDVTDVDDEHYWSFLDASYIDDVSEAQVASRTSIYDNDYYRTLSDPANIPSNTPIALRASLGMMHVFIQLPRLICLVRHASNYPEDSRTLAAVMSLLTYLWAVTPVDTMQELITSSATLLDIPPLDDAEVVDIVSDSYHFDSVQNSMLASRFWRLQVSLCGLLQTVHKNFPAAYSASNLPPISFVYELDEHAAICLARSFRYSLEVCPSLPLLPLRFYNCFQASYGTWYRQTLRFTAAIAELPTSTDPGMTTYLNTQLSRATRMEQFVQSCFNTVHCMWGLQRVNKRFLRAVAIDMAGGPIPLWMPIRVRFEDEAGALVMKMEYDVAGPHYREIMEDHYTGQAWTRKTTSVSPFRPDTADVKPGKGFPNGSGDAAGVMMMQIAKEEERYAGDLDQREIQEIPSFREFMEEEYGDDSPVV